MACLLSWGWVGVLDGASIPPRQRENCNLVPFGGGERSLKRQGVRFWTGAGWHLRGGCPPSLVGSHAGGPSQGRPCNVVSRPVPGGGSRLSLGESPDAKSRGGGPPAPLFYGPLVPTRWFWRLCRIVSVAGLLRCPSACPDLGSHFAGAGLGKKAASQTSGPRKGRNEM